VEAAEAERVAAVELEQEQALHVAEEQDQVLARGKVWRPDWMPMPSHNKARRWVLRLMEPPAAVLLQLEQADAEAEQAAVAAALVPALVPVEELFVEVALVPQAARLAAVELEREQALAHPVAARQLAAQLWAREAVVDVAEQEAEEPLLPLRTAFHLSAPVQMETFWSHGIR